MKAYIDANTAKGGGWYADVVTEQDYYERGAFARSHRTVVVAKREDAELQATLWAKDQKMTIVTVENI